MSLWDEAQGCTVDAVAHAAQFCGTIVEYMSQMCGHCLPGCGLSRQWITVLSRSSCLLDGIGGQWACSIAAGGKWISSESCWAPGSDTTYSPGVSHSRIHWKVGVCGVLLAHNCISVRFSCISFLCHDFVVPQGLMCSGLFLFRFRIKLIMVVAAGILVRYCIPSSGNNGK